MYYLHTKTISGHPMKLSGSSIEDLQRMAGRTIFTGSYKITDRFDNVLFEVK